MNTTFDGPTDPTAAPPKKKSGCLMGCLITVGVVLVICMILAALIAPRVRGWTADIMSQGINELVRESDLPEAQKAELKALGDSFTRDFKSGDIPFSAFGEIAEEAQRRGLIDVMMLYALEAHAQASQTLTAEEKADAQRQIQRATRGLLESKIKQPDVEAVTKDLREGEQQISDAKVKSHTAQLKKLADDAMVPDEPYEPDLAREFRDLLQRALPAWNPPAPGAAPKP